MNPVMTYQAFFRVQAAKAGLQSQDEEQNRSYKT